MSLQEMQQKIQENFGSYWSKRWVTDLIQIKDEIHLTFNTYTYPFSNGEYEIKYAIKENGLHKRLTHPDAEWMQWSHWVSELQPRVETKVFNTQEYFLLESISANMVEKYHDKNVEICWSISGWNGNGGSMTIPISDLTVKDGLVYIHTIHFSTKTNEKGYGHYLLNHDYRNAVKRMWINQII